ncbi:MAG: hypothetical protein ABI772_14600 [Bacteroidota bacterium]
MKPIAKLIIILMFPAFLNAQDLAQKTPRTITQTMDLVVEVPELNRGNYETLKKQLDKIQNMKVEGYCNSEKLLYLRFSPDQYFNVLVGINEAGFPYYIKKNTSISKGMEACSDKSQLFLRENRND